MPIQAKSLEIQDGQVKSVRLAIPVRATNESGNMGYPVHGQKAEPVFPYQVVGHESTIEKLHESRPDVIGPNGEIVPEIVASGHMIGGQYGVVVEVSPHPDLVVKTQPRATSESIRRKAGLPDTGADLVTVSATPPIGRWFEWISDWELVFDPTVYLPQNYAADRVAPPAVKEVQIH